MSDQEEREALADAHAGAPTVAHERVHADALEAALTASLRAIADPTRRSILTTLVQQGPSRVTDLSAYYEMSLNAVSKHIKVLESASLVQRRKWGRVHLIEADMNAIEPVEHWLRQLQSIWSLRLDELASLIEQEK